MNQFVMYLSALFTPQRKADRKVQLAWPPVASWTGGTHRAAVGGIYRTELLRSGHV